MLHSPSIDTDVVTTSHAARLLERSENSVRQLADRGLLACRRVGSLRLYAVADINRLRAERVLSAAR
jgi:hypothetical protein